MVATLPAMLADPGPVPFFTLPVAVAFVAAGVYVVAGRFYVDLKQRESTFYGLTDRRAIIVRGLARRRVTSLSLSTMTELTLEQKPDGRGTLTFGPRGSLLGRWSRGWAWWDADEARCFELVENARLVYDLADKARTELRRETR
jgi:hypothetical protein